MHTGRDASLSWLCDACGYENEFDGVSQSTTCNCCEEPAPEAKIIKIRREWEVYHREEERKAYLEELKRRQELKQQKINRAVKMVFFVVKAIPVALIFIMLVSVLWIGLSYRARNISMSDWIVQMESNVSGINMQDKLIAPPKAASQQLGDRFSGYYGVSDNSVILIGNVGGRFILLEKNASAVWEDAAATLANFHYNWQMFWNRAKNNVQKMVGSVIRKGGAG